MLCSSFATLYFLRFCFILRVQNVLTLTFIGRHCCFCIAIMPHRKLYIFFFFVMSVLKFYDYKSRVMTRALNALIANVLVSIVFKTEKNLFAAEKNHKTQKNGK